MRKRLIKALFGSNTVKRPSAVVQAPLLRERKPPEKVVFLLAKPDNPPHFRWLETTCVRGSQPINLAMGF
jgi:hypothetical protein